VTVIDPECSWKVDVKGFRSRSKNCPYDGWDMHGKAVMTLVSGEIKYNGLPDGRL